MKFYLAVQWEPTDPIEEIECDSLDDALAGWQEMNAVSHHFLRMFYRSPSAADVALRGFKPSSKLAKALGRTPPEDRGKIA